MPFRPEDQPRDVDLLIALLAEKQAEIDHLYGLLKLANDARFGARSERGCVVLPDQGMLDLGDLEVLPEAVNDDGGEPEGEATPRRRARRNIGALPRHFPRVERIIEPEGQDCPCCAGALHRIGEDISEAVDWVPARIRVIRTVRPRYACRQCRGGIVQAPAPKRLIEGGMATTSTLAWIATMRFAWSVPLNRQMQMLAGQGLLLDRSVPVGWMKRVAWWLEGLYQRQLAFIHSQPRIFVDETRMPVLEKGRRRTRIGQFWAHAIDDRPWNGPAPPAVIYVYKNGRTKIAAREQLGHYAGILQVDGYAVYKALAKGKPVMLAFCLAHARRKFVEAHKKTSSPIALDVIACIADIYRVEAEARGQGADARRALRQEKSAPRMAELKALLEVTLPQLSTKSALYKAMNYMLGHWNGLVRFLDDGRIEVDTNTVERSMRSVAQGRKSSLFAGSEAGAHTWAVLASLLQTARLNGLDPYTWLNDVLERVVSGAVKNHELDQLLAWNWRPAGHDAMALAA